MPRDPPYSCRITRSSTLVATADILRTCPRRQGCTQRINLNDFCVRLRSIFGACKHGGGTAPVALWRLSTASVPLQYGSFHLTSSSFTPSFLVVSNLLAYISCPLAIYYIVASRSRQSTRVGSWHGRIRFFPTSCALNTFPHARLSRTCLILDL